MFRNISKKVINRMKFVTGLETVKPVELTTKTDFSMFGRKIKKK